MKKSYTLRGAALAIPFLLMGCVLSLQPLYTDETLVFKEELIGTWSNEDHTWTFERERDNKRYELLYTDNKQNTGEFEATLVELDGLLFLDLFPEDLEKGGAPYWKYHFMKGHSFLLVDELGPQLKMRLMNPKWLTSYLKKNPDEIAATIQEDRPILTASTETLQQFVPKLAKMSPVEDGDDQAFGKQTTLSKQN